MGIFSRFYLSKGSLVMNLRKQIVSAPLSLKITPTEQRVPLDKLEGLYWKDPIVYNSINIIANIAMNSGSQIVGKNSGRMNTFVDGIGKVGNNLTWYELRERTLKYTCIYGRSFWELIYNTQGNRIVDMDILDPKRIDYAKNSKDQIVLNESGNPVGFTQNMEDIYGIDVQNKIEPPEGVKLGSRMIYFPADHIAMFKLNCIGDGFYPVGLIEPIYDVSLQKKREEVDISNASRAPIRDATVGDINHNPTNDMLQSAADELAAASPLSAHAHPYWIQSKIVEPSQPQNTTVFLDYCRNRQIEGLGVPEAFATGRGESTNRSTLARQEYILKLLVKSLVDRSLVQVINQSVFRRIAELEGLESPKYVYGQIAMEDVDAKANRISKYAQMSLVTPSAELMKYLLDSEEIPEEQQGRYSKPADRQEGNKLVEMRDEISRIKEFIDSDRKKDAASAKKVELMEKMMKRFG